MKIKVLFYTDPHNSDRPPLMRKEDYCEEILRKQEQLIEPAKGCDLVICGGDVYHQKNPGRISHYLVNRLCEIYREFPRLYIVPGNHDFDKRFEEIEYNPLGTLGRLPNIEIKHREIMQFGGFNFYFFGGGDFFSPSQFLDFVEEEPEHIGAKVGVFHIPFAVNKSYPFVLWDVKKVLSRFNHIFLGHLHDFQNNDGWITAPGALSRGSLTIDSSLDREIYYAKGRAVGENFSVVFEELNVKSSDEVFKMEEKRDNVHQQRAIESFVNYIEKLKIPKGMSKEQLLVFIDKQDVSEPVKREARRILEGLDDV